MTVLDLIVIVVVLISAILAMVRGFVREVLSIASWVAAAGAAYFLYKSVVPLVTPYIDSHTVQRIVAAAAIFFIALIIATYITIKISDFVIDSRVGAVDRALGFLFGAARGILLVVIALLFFNWLVQPSPAWVANARSKRDAGGPRPAAGRGAAAGYRDDHRQAAARYPERRRHRLERHRRRQDATGTPATPAIPTVPPTEQRASRASTR